MDRGEFWGGEENKGVPRRGGGIGLVGSEQGTKGGVVFKGTGRGLEDVKLAANGSVDAAREGTKDGVRHGKDEC
eukprot:746820-Hanusia_phi.AAC.2